MQTDFSSDTQQLFSPIIKATGDVKTAAERVMWGDKDPTKEPRKETPLIEVLETIATETAKKQQEIQELKTQRESKKTNEQIVNELRARFNEQGLAAIDTTDPAKIPAFVVQTFENRKKMLKPEQYKYVKNIQHWADIFYKIKTKNSRIDTNNASYIDYMNAVGTVYDAYEAQKQQQIRGGRERRRRQQSPEIERVSTERVSEDSQGFATGSGLSRNARVSGASVSRSSSVTCPGNILSDISRLEVLIGGKRAGNNSIEIINEAADICRRLFQSQVMDIHTYRELIEELAENHRDAHGYYSD
jgi:hypothetical protein